MTLEQKKLAASVEAIKTAITGRDPNGFSQILLDDVGRVIAAIPSVAREEAEWVNDLAVGVAANPKGTVAFQRTGHLAELIEVYGTVAAIPEAPSE